MVEHPNYIIRGGGAAWEVAMVVAMENEVNDYFNCHGGGRGGRRKRQGRWLPQATKKKKINDPLIFLEHGSKIN